jgi:Flp pilus assembly protein TadG
VRNLLKNQKGAVLMLVGASLPVLIGAAGLATDTVQWTLWKRQLQRQADSAALAGAYGKTQAKDVVAASTADINRNMTTALTAAPTIENAPTVGPYAGNAQAVRVVLQTQKQLPFSGLFMSSAPVIKAEATAAAVAQGDYCVIALEPNSVTGINMTGNTTVNLGCGMATNSKASNAVIATGSSEVTASPIAAVGGLQSSNNYKGSTTLQPYSPPQVDPFAGLPVPAPIGCDEGINIGPKGNETINPGCYEGMDIKGTVTLNPGVYYIDGSSVKFGAQAEIYGTGVTIILTSTNAGSDPSSIATFDMNGGATVNLSAPTTGTYAGVLIYQDRRALDSGTNKINGNSSSKYQGAIYMPTQEVEFSGTAGMNTKCLQLVARRVKFTGNSNILNVTNGCPANSGAKSFTGTRIRLVA